jgi:hypothetical protein
MQHKRWLTLSGLAIVFSLSLCASGPASMQAGQPLSQNPDVAVESTIALGQAVDPLTVTKAERLLSQDPDLAIRATTAISAWVVDYSGTPKEYGAASILASSGRSSLAADDFFIPAGVGIPPGQKYAALVSKVTVNAYASSLTTANLVNLYFYRNSGSLPVANPASSGRNLVPQGSGLAAGNFYVNTFAVLSPNQMHWISVQVNIGSGSNWYWAESDPTKNSVSAWQSNEDYLINCKNVWGQRVDLCSQPPASETKGRDLSFRVEGDFVIFTDEVFLPAVLR